MNKKFMCAALASALLLAGCKAAEPAATEVPASLPAESLASEASTEASATSSATESTAPSEDIPSLDEMDFEDVLLYIVEDKLLTDQDIIDMFGSTTTEGIPQTVEDYVADCVEESHDYYYATDVNTDAGILNIAEINYYMLDDDDGTAQLVQVWLVEVDPDTVDDYSVGGKVTVHLEYSVEYYDENDEPVEEAVVEDEQWPITAISGNYILVATEYDEDGKPNTEAPFEDEELQAVYDAFDALG